MSELLVLRVRLGELQGSGSWVYAWLGAAGVVYVGATGLHPATRTWLHLTDENPNVGLVRARYPGWDTEELDVVALQLADDEDRQAVKHAIVRLLSERGLLSERHVCDPPAAAPPSTSAEQLVDAVAKRQA